MNRSFSEDSRVKFPTIMHLTQMGYEYVSLNGVKKYDVPAVEFDPLTNILTKQFTDAFLSLNPDLEEADAAKKLKDIQDSLANDDLGREFFYKILQEPGVGRIIDLSTEENFRNNNTFQVATEMTCGDKSSDNFRPDITLFINGLPLAFIEVKKENNDTGIKAETERMKKRFENDKFRRYLNITQIMVFSNDMEYDDLLTQGAYYATIGRHTTCYNCFREDGQTSFPILHLFEPLSYKTEQMILTDNNVEAYIASDAYLQNRDNFDTPTKRIVNSLFTFNRFRFLLKYGICYVDEPNGLQKHIMRYPQIFATKAIERALNHDLRKGIIWHTQGSGKTALAYYNVKFLTEYYSSKGIIPQFFFIVDRLALMQQAQQEFSKRGLVVNPIDTKDDFKKIISSNKTTRNAEGKPEITVVNIQKFSDDSRATSKNDYNLNIQRIYFIDEAHRDYNPAGCFLKTLIQSDPNAIRIALTGTPIISREYRTTDIFGDYIHTYYYNASIADRYTLRLIREDIGSNFKIKMQEILNSIRVTVGSVNAPSVYRHHSYVQPLLDYVMDDLKAFRVKNSDNSLGGMVVCNSSEQAKLMYRLFLEKYADTEELANERGDDGQIIYKSVGPEVIDAKMAGPQKGYYRAALILYDSDDKDARAKWINLFKEGKVDLLIVYQMLQTGFNSPRLKKLYLHRVVKDHNLLQTLTRVNRPYKEMRFGYVVDFANIEEEYNKTSKDYEKELEAEQGAEAQQHSDLLLVSLEEAEKRYKESVAALEGLDLGNPQTFSRQLDLEDDRDRVKTILHSLEEIRDLGNMLISQGHAEVLKVMAVEQKGTTSEAIPNINNFIKAARNRYIFLGFQQGVEDNENVQQLLNMALEDIEFSFYKRGEAELELKEQYREALAHTRQQLAENIDPDDPRYRSLLEEFLRLFRKKDMDIAENFNLHAQVKNLNDILKRIKKINEEDAITALRYNNDRKFARIEKRIQEKDKQNEEQSVTPNKFAWSKDKEKLNLVLLKIKEECDENFFLNTAMINAPGYFTKFLVEIIAQNFLNADIRSDRETRYYVGDLINREYQNEYR